MSAAQAGTGWAGCRLQMSQRQSLLKYILSSLDPKMGGEFLLSPSLAGKICSSSASSLRSHLCLFGEMLGQNEETA